ncbi:type II toxin-antitoxin system RelE/ParE family toxin [Streptomyces sp. NPDC059477]|uniref:type II toxin-antitoxin system RelE/ParE family toxin n=1 Tax=Streptomyces sp. NPDC059477 TaxID=3346847 RepID=UPI003686CBC8
MSQAGVRVQFSDRARAQWAAMKPGPRDALDAGMRRLAAAPYGLGSERAPGRPQTKDRRVVSFPDAIVLYWVHDSVLTITAVDIIH